MDYYITISKIFMICSDAGMTVAAVFALLFSLLNFDFLCHVTLYAGSFRKLVKLLIVTCVLSLGFLISSSY